MSAAPEQRKSFSKPRRKSSVVRSHVDSDRLGPIPVSRGYTAGCKFNLVYIGAGNINFGSDQGPWDHSFRIEQKLGPRLNVVAIVDPMAARAQEVLDRKRSSFVAPAYGNTRICPNIEEFVNTMKPEEYPHALIVGSPAAFRGSDRQGRDFELQVLNLFKGRKIPALFIEKPISTDTVDHVMPVARALEDSGTVVSVGYFLRYLKVVQKMREILEQNNLHVAATVARYVSAYTTIKKPAWWTKSIDQGPVVEQGTHFVDLSRYFGGDVDMDTVQAQSLEWYEEAGELSEMPIDEDEIAPDDRVPRVTAATWKYRTGGVGTFVHSVVLQGYKYATELDIFADGYHMRLVDPYGTPRLEVRSPAMDDPEIYSFPGDDPYFGELSAFVDACDPDANLADNAKGSAIAEEGDDELENSNILSSYRDAAKSYALTWAIRYASERTRAPAPVDTEDTPAKTEEK